MLKKFYKWRMNNLPEYVSRINVKIKENGKTPDDLITRDELNLLIENSKNARDRALFSLLYDSGCRIGEIINLKIKDLGFDEYGAVINVTGKTGFRRVRIVGDSIPYLRAWLNNHPFKDNVDSYLFCNLSDKIRGRILTYHNIYSIIRETKRRAGINKRIHPHLFRHTRATLLASKVPEAPLENQMGWVHGSKQTRTYVHLSMRDQDKAILKAYGIDLKEDDVIKDQKPKECPRCHTLNPSNAKFCTNCWLPLDIETQVEVETKEKIVIEAIKNSDAFEPSVKRLISEAPDDAKFQLLVILMEEIAKDPKKMEKLRDALGK